MHAQIISGKQIRQDRNPFYQPSWKLRH